MSKVTIRKVAKRITLSIRSSVVPGNKYSGGLASEGYQGGYRDALNDVLLFLGGTRPHGEFWKDEHYLDAKEESGDE